MVHAHSCSDLSQPRATAGEESAQQATAPQTFQASVPLLQANPDTMEDSENLGRDHGFAFAEQPAGVINHKQIAAQREAFEHPFT